MHMLTELPFDSKHRNKARLDIGNINVTSWRRSGGVSVAVPIHYRPFGNPAAAWLKGQSLYLSLTELNFVSDPWGRVKAGETLDIRLALPGSQQIIDLRGQVVTVDDCSGEAIFTHTACRKDRQDATHSTIILFIAERTWQAAAMRYKETHYITTRVAANYDDYTQAGRLLYKEYYLRGYCPKNDQGLHFNYFAALPDSRTALIIKGEAVVGTFSVIPDTLFGLPAESIYADEIACLRQQKRKLAELSLLALDGEHWPARNSYLLADPDKFLVFVRLMKATIDYACQCGVTDVLVATHPKHELTYRFLLFRRIGAVRTYETVGGNLAILMRADLPEIRRLHNVVMESSDPDMATGIAAYLYHCRTCDAAGMNNQLVSQLLHVVGSKVPPVVSEYLQYCYPEMKDVASRSGEIL